MSKPKPKYIVVNKQVIPVYPLGDEYFIAEGPMYTVSDKHVYEDKMDAMYYKLVQELQFGKPIENFKTSKYYGYYIERLKKENPEYIL